MKFSFTRLFFFVSVLGILTSCLDSSSSTAVSSDGAFYSLKFSSDDSVPNIQNTSFAIANYKIGNDSVIENKDSIAYLADIDDVIATFTFNTTAGSAYVYTDKHDTIALNSGSDTIDCTRPFKVINYPSDGSSPRTYVVKVNRHKVNPSFFRWTPLDNKPDLADDMLNQKLIAANSKVYYFYNNGSSAWMQSSSDGIVWGAKTELTNFPTNSSLHNMQFFNGSFYATDKTNNIYSSADGTNWTKEPTADYQFYSLLFTYGGTLWAIVRNSSDEYRFATLAATSGAKWIVRGIIPTGFPVYDFASLAYTSRNNIPKALIVGGRTANGAAQTDTWGTENGTYWAHFSRDNKSLDTLAVGATIFQYNKRLMMVGYRTDKDSTEWRQSVDEGFSWQGVDSLVMIRQPHYVKKDYYPYHDSVASFTNYTQSKFPTVAVLNYAKFDTVPTLSDTIGALKLRHSSNNIILIGGFNKSGKFTKEVWYGKLNKLNFLRQTVK